MVEKDQINRRDVLKTVAVGGAVPLGMSSTASAFSKARPDRVNTLLEDAKVQSIIDTIPNLSLKTDRAESTTALDDLFTVHKIPANAGSLSIVEFTGSDRRDAMLKFENQNSNVNVNSSVPRGTESMLVGAHDGATLHRTTTADESEAILNTVGKEAGDFYIETTSENDGYRVLRIDSSNDMVERFEVNAQTGVAAMPTSADLRVVSNEYIPTSPRGDISPQGGCPDCRYLLGNAILCIHSLGGCALCLALGLAPPALLACVIAAGCIGIPDLVDMGCLSSRNIPCIRQCI